MELRPYQTEIVNKVLHTKTKDLIQLPTAGGKTIIAGDICNKYLFDEKKVLFLAHREELITQPKEKFFEHFGINSSIIKGSTKSDLSLNMQIASVQTYNKRLNFEPDVIFIDEAHHSEAKTYKKIINAHQDAKLIGLTATPYRLNGEGFSETFDNLITSKTVKELEELKWLVPARCFSYPIGHDKLSRIKVTGGDYNEQQLEDLMNDRVLIEDIVVSYQKHAQGKKMIVFASSVEHSKSICKRFKQIGIMAAHIDANTKKRNEIIKEFRFCDTNVLCNVGIATEGVDIPEVEAVCLARPTKSLALYLQMCGRGSRPHGGKDEYILLDHADNFWEHGAPNKDHDWEKYFNGISRLEKKAIDSRKKYFEIEFEDGGILVINDILQIPVDVKGFVLEEVAAPNYFPNAFIYEYSTEDYCDDDMQRAAAMEIYEHADVFMTLLDNKDLLFTRNGIEVLGASFGAPDIDFENGAVNFSTPPYFLLNCKKHGEFKFYDFSSIFNVEKSCELCRKQAIEDAKRHEFKTNFTLISEYVKVLEDAHINGEMSPERLKQFLFAGTPENGQLSTATP